MMGAMSLNTIPLLIINQCAQNILCASFGKIILVLIQKNVYRDYLHVYSGGGDNLTRNSSFNLEFHG